MNISWAKKFIRFGEIEFEKQEFCSCEIAIHTDDVKTTKIIMSNEVPCSKTAPKYFVGQRKIMKKMHRCVPCYDK